MNVYRYPYKAHKIVWISLITLMVIFTILFSIVLFTVKGGLYQKIGIIIVVAIMILTIKVARKNMQSTQSKREVVISDISIISPKALLRSSNSEVLFTDIKNIKLQGFSILSVVQIIHKDGKLQIPATTLPSMEDFEELVSVLRSRVDIKS